MMKRVAKFNSLEMTRKYPAFRPNDIDHLRGWLEKMPHLPQIADHEIFLFLHAEHFKVEPCKLRMDKFYTMRTRIKTMFEDRDVARDEFQFAHDDYAFWLLPKPTPDGRRVLISKILNPNRFNFRMILKLMTFVGEVELWTNPDEICNGYIILVDLTNSRLAHMTQIDFLLNKQMMTYTVDAYPFRISDVHFINAPSHMERILSIVKACVRKEVTDRFYVHSSVDDLPSSIPKEILPKDYKGGLQKTIAELNDDHYAFLHKNREFYLDEVKCRRVNERLRRGKISFEADLFGLDGNFKKLDID